MRYLIALASLALIWPSIDVYRACDLSAARGFVRKYDVEKRRPEVAHTVSYAPSPDWAAEIVADSSLRDAYEPINLLDVTPEVREAWIRTAGRVDDELRDARAQLLDAIAVRPGWPFYQSLLGQTAFAIESRSFSRDLIAKQETWSLPLLNAARGAPNASSAWRSLAATYLQTWPLLSSIHNANAGEVFRHAFSDSDFVRVAFPDAARLLGSDRAIAYVPDTPQSLVAAFDFFAKANDVAHAWPLRQRWERAEWRDRVEDTMTIERHARRGDVDDVRMLCDRWTSRHSVWDYDTPDAHAQAARLLDLWPGGRHVSWAGDPIADLARYLITRNDDGDKYAPIVARQIDSFTGVPVPTLAEVRLRAGDVGGAERIAKSAEDAGSLDWTDYLLTLASRDKEALKRLSPAAMETHEVRLVRGEGAAEGGGAPLSRCGANNEIAVHGASTQHIRLTASSPTIVDVGLNRARSASLLVDGERPISFTLIGWRDQTVFSRTLAGDTSPCVTVAP